MAINITQFAPPSRVSSLVWDKNMEPPAGKVFEGDLVGNVTGDVTGDLTGVVRGSLLGYLSRNGVYSASSGALVAPASSSTGNTPVTVNLNLGGGGTYAIVGNTQKCYIENPCSIPVVFDKPQWGSYIGAQYAKSYTSDNVEIDSISDSGNLNIYGAAYIVLNGGKYTDNESTQFDGTTSVADAYIDAGTSLILGDDTPPDGPKVSKLVWDADMVPAVGKKFSGNLTGNVTGNVAGNVTGNVTGNLTGKIIVNGCSWYNSELSGEALEGHGLIPIIYARSVTSVSSGTSTGHAYISYPYMGVFDFQPKPAAPPLNFTVTLSGPSQSETMGARLEVRDFTGITVLRSYSKYNDIGTFTFPVDLTDAYRLYIYVTSAPDNTVTGSINSLYVKTPFIESLVDEV